MKKIAVLVIMTVGAVAVNLFPAGTASGRNEYFKQFQVHYKESKVLEKVKKERCNTCHYGKSKKNRNDYGTELAKHLTKDLRKEFKKARDVEGFNKKISESLEKVEKAKSKSGVLFGKLIESGELPGTVPEDAESE